MIIEYSAFHNCISLKEMHFEYCEEAINTNIHDSNTPECLQLIVPDKYYSSFANTEFYVNRRKLLKHSDFLQKQLDELSKSNKINKIALSIIYLYDVIALNLDKTLNQCLDTLCKNICKTCSISNDAIAHIKALKDKIQEIRHGSRL